MEQSVRIGQRIREERERLGLKQDQLGVAPKTQRFYESGERSPDAEYLGRFAEAGADVLYVLTGQHAAGVLAPEEAALIDNYRNASEASQTCLQITSAALAAHDGQNPKEAG